MTDKTVVTWPVDLQRVWWSGHVQHGDARGMAFVEIVGTFRGTPVQVAEWAVRNIGLLRRGVKLPALQANAEPCEVWIRTWGNASEMLLSAARNLKTLVPSLVPLPVGFGVMYLRGPLTAEDEFELRAFADLARNRRQLLECTVGDE